MKNKYVKIAVNVPESHADALREAIGKAGAGKIGNYSFCSFSSTLACWERLSPEYISK